MSSPAARVRVALGSASPALRAGLGALLDAAGVQVVASEARASGLLAADATLWVVDEATLEQLDANALDSAAVVMLASPDGPSRVLRASLTAGKRTYGLAVVPPDVTLEELGAAVIAADAGFIVLPPALLRDLVEPELTLTAGGSDLTSRERDVLQGLAAGASNKRIAARLGLSPNTVKYHLSSLYSKLGVTSRAGAVREGVRLGLLSI